MGRAPCCDKANVKKGPWSPEEDAKLKEYIEKYGTGGNWIALPHKAGLKRCGKSCRLRWLNYLRPNIKHGDFSDDEDRIICNLYANIGSRWSIIAAQLPGRTDNDIKNYWNTKLKKKLMAMTMIHPSHPHQFSYFLQALRSSSLPSTSSSTTTALSSPHKSNTLAWSYNEPIPFFRPLSNNNTTAMAQHQESYMQNNYQVIKDSNSLLMFGGDQVSCSSSDGSCNNQIGHAKELEYDYGGPSTSEQMGYFYNGMEDHSQKLVGGGGGGGNGWGDNQIIDYGLDEIKQLISAATTTASSSCNNFLFEDNKTEERVVHY